MGFVSKLASATHASTMDRRVLERYRVQLDVVQSLLKRQSHSPSPGLKNPPAAAGIPSMRRAVKVSLFSKRHLLDQGFFLGHPITL